MIIAKETNVLIFIQWSLDIKKARHEKKFQIDIGWYKCNDKYTLYYYMCVVFGYLQTWKKDLFSLSILTCLGRICIVYTILRYDFSFMLYNT